MSKLSVGDLVAVYCYGERYRMKVVHAVEPDRVWVENEKDRLFVHVKQCRKITKLNRRRVFILKSQMGRMYDATGTTAWAIAWTDSQTDSKDFVEFVEVKRKI